MKERGYFQFFREWYEPLQIISNAGVKLRLLEMIVVYSLDGKEPTNEDLSGLDDVGRMYWETTFPKLQNSRKNFLNGSKSKGAPKGSSNAAKFKIPTLGEIYAYFGSNNFSSDPDRFFNYNESMGWDGCKKHFKDWKTAADRWEEMGGDYDE